MYTNQIDTSNSSGLPFSWQSNANRPSVANKPGTATLFLNIGATGCIKVDSIIKKG